MSILTIITFRYIQLYEDVYLGIHAIISIYFLINAENINKSQDTF